MGILSAALKKGQLSSAGYAAMMDWTTRLNTPGPRLAALPGVHAMTDVTGFGLAGHLLEMCRGAGLSAEVNFAAIPVIAEALNHVQSGIATGASTRNWSGYGHEVHLPPQSPEWKGKLLSDPQTSGGLLVACKAESVAEVLVIFQQDGFAEAAVIGSLHAGAPGISVQ